MSTLSITNIKNRLSQTNAIEIDSNNNVVFRADMTILGTATIGNMSIGQDFTVGDQLTVNGNTVLGNAPTDTLSVSGAATIGSSLGVTGNTELGGSLSVVGATSIAGLTYTGTLTGGTGVVNIGSGQIYKAAGGNVGVGTASPGAKFDVAGGDILLSTNSQYVRAKDAAGNIPRAFGFNSGSTFFVGPIDTYAGGGINYGASANVASHAFQTSGVTRLFINSTGSVGVGTTSPQGILHTSASNGVTILESPGISSVGLRFRTNLTDRWQIQVPSGSEDLAFYTGAAAVERLRIDSAGNVGVGTSAPISRLSIANPSGTDGLSVLRGLDYTSPAFRVSVDGVRPRLYGYGEGLTFWTGAVGAEAERLRIDSAGNMGLGVTPSAWGGLVRAVQVANAASLSARTGGSGVYLSDNLYFSGDPAGTASNGVYINSTFATTYQQFGGTHRWFNAPPGTAGNPITFTQAMMITQGGNLLVGTTTAVGSSNIQAVSEIAVGRNGVAEGAYILYGTGGQRGALSCNAAETRLSANNNTNLTFYSGAGAGSERARITSGGYFKASNTGSYGGVAGIGDLSTAAAHVMQSDANSGTVFTLNSNIGSAVRNYDSYLATGAAGIHYSARLNNVVVYQVLANGNVQNTNNSYGALSDAKLKENVVDVSPILSEFMQVRFRNFNFIGSDLKQFGVIAQELETVFPGLVDETPDLDADGNELGTVTKSVKYSVLALMAGKVIQEQQEIIEKQQATINDILARLSALEAK